MTNSSGDEFKDAKKNLAIAKAKAKALRPWYQKKRFVIPIAFILLAVFASLGNQNSSELPSNPSGGTSNQETPQAPVEPQSTETIGQENARNKGEDYLRSSCFSKQGLIEQLEYEGFSSQDAKYAVVAISPDWNEQAACKAEAYLRSSSFSRTGLIDQLLYEGFSKSQAEFGVSSVGY